jgi:hypothetical protein
MAAMPPPRPLLAALLLAAVAATAGADVVHLANGSRLEGRVLSDDESGVLLEQASPSGRTQLRIPRDRIRSVERTAPAPGTTEEPEPGRPVRDEWFLLRADTKVVGTRHLLLLRRGAGADAGWRIEEDVYLAASPRLPAVRIRRIEDVTDEFLPVWLQYRERGDPGAGFRDEAYETSRAGPVRDGVWRMTERELGGVERRADVELPRLARGPLAIREALARARPRPLGLVEMPLIDTSKGEVRTVRAGFTGLDVGGEGAPRQDALRVEDGERTLDGRWGSGEPPPCFSETVAPGIVAEPCTPEQAEAFRGEGSEQRMTLPDAGFEVIVPGAAWVPEIVPAVPGVEGLRLVAKVASRLHAADVRFEWDPAGATGTPQAAEAALLERLRTGAKARDLTVDIPREPVLGLENAWRLSLTATVRGERVRSVLFVADRGRGRAVLLATSPLSAWEDARIPLETILASFRWL